MINGTPREIAAKLVEKHGFAMANETAYRWQVAYGGAGSAQGSYWVAVVTALRHHAKSLDGRRLTKSERRRLRERRIKLRGAR